ncbi:MAG: hypothetical protein SFX73_12365 [Kofleriaceae bacterium]|nr:hypothetical protein [Kofleriaceae bacterium]
MALCGSGMNADCKDGSTTQLQCCPGSAALTSASDKTTTVWGADLECGPNEVMRGICGSGQNPDCGDGRITNGLKCARLPDNRELYDAVWKTSGFGQMAQCDSGYVAAGLCGSGRNADCKHNGANVVNKIKCAKVRDLTSDCSTMKAEIERLRPVPGFDGDSCIGRLATCSRAALQECGTKKTDLERRRLAASMQSENATFAADPENRLVSLTGEAHGQTFTTSCPSGKVLELREATYGAGVPGVVANNVRHEVSNQCAYKSSCSYAIDVGTLGDVAPGSAKPFVGKFRCVANAAAATPCMRYWNDERVKLLRERVTNLAAQFQTKSCPTDRTLALKCTTYRQEVESYLNRELSGTGVDSRYGVIEAANQRMRALTQGGSVQVADCHPPGQLIELERAFMERLTWANANLR